MGLAAATSSSASAADSSIVDSGTGWTVSQVAGGYKVDLTLDQPLPVRNDLPVLFADDVNLGPATASADGTKLSVTTTDTAVASAGTVFWQWSTGGASTSDGPTTLPKDKVSALPKKNFRTFGATPTANDPTTIGTDSYTVADYNFGAQSIGLANLGGVRGELEGRVYLPSGGGQHPVVIFEHGRHSACYNLTTLKGFSGWPCPTGTAPILSYAGYDGAGEALAAAGYTVVSISVNSINANDAALGADAGAVARGQAILDTLTMLKHANAGDTVSYHDAAANADVSLDQALVAGQATSPASESLTAADLVGTMDFSKIGIMGHSRGGEGAVTAGLLNEALPNPWAIKSIFALAPIDFTRASLPDVITTTLLPYCDGDVSDQQGQHFYADSRNTFDDNVARSNIWVMGTDHNFFNTSWTPPYPAATDDWAASNDAVCGSSDTAHASGTNIRLSAPQQYSVGAAYISGFFELTLGGATQFQGMFDGSGTLPPSVAGFADVRTVVQQPSSKRVDITDFASTSPMVSTSATASAAICASRYGRTVPQTLATCTSSAVALTSQAQPYWTPANYAPNVPLNQMTHLTWTATTGSLSVTIPKAKTDVSAFDEMTVNLSPDESVTNGTDLTLSVQDSSGNTWSSLLSALNPWTVNRMPGSDSPSLHKLVLQQAHVPTATLANAGLDLKHITRVTFTGAVGVDGSSAGGEYLQDLTFSSAGLGTTSVQTRSTVNVSSTKVEEGNGASTDAVAVYLSTPSTKTSSAYLTVIGSATGKAGLAVQKVTFAPGEVCQAVEIPVTGDTQPGTTSSTAYKIAVSKSTNAVLGKNDFGTITVREDDGLSTGGTPAAAVGIQGDPCTELNALSTNGTLKVDTKKPAPGSTIVVTGSGYRSGESVALTIGSGTPTSAIANPDGTVSFTATVPADQAYGDTTLTATGAGSGYTSTGSVTVLATTDTSLAITPAVPTIKQAVTLTATVDGDATDGGTVEFFDGTTSLGTDVVSSGTASIALPNGFLAGEHDLTASFGETATANASVSNPVVVTLQKGKSTIALGLSSGEYTFGQSVSGVIAVAGATDGTATVTSGSTVISVAIGASGTGKFTLPGTIGGGDHTVTATYDGTDFVDASATASADFTVTRAETTTTLSLSKTTVGHGNTETVKVTVGGVKAGVYPTGTITVTAAIGSTKTTKTVTLSSSNKGVISFSIRLPSRKGTATLHTTYSGNANYLPSTAEAKKVKVN
ncbi:MAG: hypothetical protein JWQ12_951 [Glaciihabitans sp.]|nr:hypothetical protein [Glaciihabitans sp.]